jgi:hypothetical protein
VRALTTLLTTSATRTRLDRHATFCRQALGLPARAGVGPVLQQFQAALHTAWRLPCANSAKEPLWRLAVDCTPGCTIRPWLCHCARTPFPSARLHTFWDCPVAQAVRTQIDHVLAPSAPTPTSRANVWLLGPPPLPHITPGVWTLVCLCALAAMEYGRTLLWAQHHHLPAAPAPQWANPLRAVSNAAVARFWHLLQDFARANPRHWTLPHSHPFLHTITTADPRGRLDIHLPSPTVPSGAADATAP